MLKDQHQNYVEIETVDETHKFNIEKQMRIVPKLFIKILLNKIVFREVKL